MRSLLVVLVLVSHPAWADRAAAQRLADEAEKSGDPDAFVACGQAFIEAYNQDTLAAHIDELLFDAARCFESGNSISAALQSYEVLIKTKPSSWWVPKAMVRSAALYEQIAFFDRAARRDEEYASDFAGESEALAMLEAAIRLRAALGDTAKQIEDTDYLVKTFGAKQRRLAARAELALLPVLSSDQAVALLRNFLRGFAIDADDTIAAHVELGDRLRARSCPIKPVDGLCVELRIAAGPHCGAVATRVVVHTRTAANRDAITEYKAALELFDTGSHPESRHAVAMARLALADDKLERLLAATFPSDLDLADAHAASMKTFSTWLALEQKLVDDAGKAYAAILADHEPISSVAAAARLGQTSQAFWRTMMIGDVPRALRAKPARDLYCEQLAIASKDLAERARGAFAMCADKAGELGVANDWTELCWRETGQLAPKELRAPVRGTPELAVEPPVVRSR